MANAKGDSTTYQPLFNSVDSFAVSSSLSLLAIASETSLRVFLSTQLSKPPLFTYPLVSAALLHFSPDGHFLLASTDDTVLIWKFGSANPQPTWRLIPLSPSRTLHQQLRSVLMHDQQLLIATASTPLFSVVQVALDIAHEVPVAEESKTLINVQEIPFNSFPDSFAYEHPQVQACGVRFSPDGRYLALVEAELLVLDTDQLSFARVFSAPFVLPSLVASFSPDGRWLSDGFQVWRVDSAPSTWAQQCSTLPYPESVWKSSNDSNENTADLVSRVVWSPDSKFLFTCTSSRSCVFAVANDPSSWSYRELCVDVADAAFCPLSEQKYQEFSSGSSSVPRYLLLCIVVFERNGNDQGVEVDREVWAWLVDSELSSLVRVH